ncbi:putative FBD-associated F-box protein At5g56820 [Arachis duranensis]|uniref:F-box domain-containing protein n=2 Tax=Arachis TaxID=3817 RepID=A0A445BPX7_ARAHY|nr:putative FBD-associated F-box protein At5g56820 [Arachis duranensis]XP_025621499.1 putative FBD-associated F-box protein At5g56820 [Arachis hypogaea]RYR40702.1 hypothetical protein Ahy_A09g046440 [Arachis hypogaea]
MDMDRISLLPNSILCDILSYLPTKQAVSTSIISHRWRHVWKDLQVLDIQYIPFLSHREDRFDSCVNAILSLRNADYPIQKFRLTSYKNSEDIILSWLDEDLILPGLDAVIVPHLHELYLCIDLRRKIKLPESIFTCVSLKSLVLNRNIYLNCYPEFPNVYLPSLKNLELDFLSVNPSKLLSGSPVLEILKLTLHNTTREGFHVHEPTIQMPRTLKSLTFEDCTSLMEKIDVREIYTPFLEYLHMRTEASGNIHSHFLKYETTQCLFSAPAFEFPEFLRLLKLEVDLPCFNTNFLLNFLHNCHVLEALGYYFHPVKYNGPTPPPTTVPNCVTSCLKSFEFRKYQDTADEHEFTAYLLQKGLVLKTVTIHLKYNLDQETKCNIVRGLSAIQKGSTICQLTFINENPI